MAIRKKIKRTAKKIRRVVANVISAPSRAKSKLRGATASRKTAVFKAKRAAKGAPDFRNGRPTNAFKIRSAAATIKRKAVRKNRKKRK